MTRCMTGYILTGMKALRAARWVLASTLAGLMVVACATQPEAPTTPVPAQPPMHAAERPPLPPAKPEPPPPPPAQPEPEPEGEAESEPEVEAPTPAVEETAEDFEVTQEVYERTFDELKRLIVHWNDLIARRNYDAWYGNLSRSYIAERGSAEYLGQLSRMQKLKNVKIVLGDLEDYFNYVVVPSRTDAELDKIAFVNENKVKAYATIDGEAAILFYVVREDGRWKIGTSEE